MVSVHTPSVSLAGFNNLLDQSTSVVVNPAMFAVENHYSLPVDLDLGIYDSVPCDLPREVVRDARCHKFRNSMWCIFFRAGSQ